MTVTAFRAGRDQPETNEVLRRKFMQMRLAYVTRMAWLPDADDDSDVYDADQDTLNLVKTTPTGSGIDGKIVCGLRVTRVQSVFESLTWRMLGTTLQERLLLSCRDDLLDLEEAGSQGGLWDLTRLTPQADGSVGTVTVAQGIYETIGAALAWTAKEADVPPKWMFLTTRTFKAFLDASHIRPRVLYSGLLSERDKEKSYLCIVDPVLALQHVRSGTGPRYAKTECHVTRGYVETNLTIDGEFSHSGHDRPRGATFV